MKHEECNPIGTRTSRLSMIDTVVNNDRRGFLTPHGSKKHAEWKPGPGIVEGRFPLHTVVIMTFIRQARRSCWRVVVRICNTFRFRDKNVPTSAPEMAHNQSGESPLQAHVLRLVANCNCITVR